MPTRRPAPSSPGDRSLPSCPRRPRPPKPPAWRRRGWRPASSGHRAPRLGRRRGCGGRRGRGGLQRREAGPRTREPRSAVTRARGSGLGERAGLTTSFPRSQAPPRSSPPRSPPPFSSPARSQAPPRSPPPRNPPTCSSSARSQAPSISPPASPQPLCCPQTCRSAPLNPPAVSVQTRTLHPFSPQLHSSSAPQCAARHHGGLQITVAGGLTALQPGSPAAAASPLPLTMQAHSCHLLNGHLTQSCSLQSVPAAHRLWLLPCA